MNPLQSHTTDDHDPAAAIVPEPAEPVRAAIMRALAEETAPRPPAGWAVAALREGVEPDECS